MTPASIALSRFGYGIGPRGDTPKDPRRWLVSQLDAFDPSPAIITKRARATGEIGAMLGLLRNLRRDTREMAEMAAKDSMMADASRGEMRDACWCRILPCGSILRSAARRR
jgi:hypothetical protein